MAYGCGGYEFPGTFGGYPDVCELLCLYKKVTDEYGDLLKAIQETQAQLKEYMDSIETEIPGWISNEVDKYISRLDELETSVQKELANNQAAVLAYLHEYSEKVATQLENQTNLVNNRLDKNEQWVGEQMQQSQATIENIIQLFRVEYRQDLNAFREEFREAFQNQNDYVDDTVERVENAQAILNALYSELTEQFDTLNEEMERWEQDVRKIVNNYFTTVRLWYMEHRYQDKKWLEDEIKKVENALANIPESKLPVFNWMRNRQTGVDEYLSDLYEFVLIENGYTAIRWERATWMSAEEFDMSGITAVQWEFDALNVLDDDRWKWSMFSPISGKWVWLGRAIQEVADALNPDAVSAGVYDGAQKTAQVYDALNITADEYRRGKY